MEKKVALVYDRVNKWGGAERVLLTLHELFPEAPLYTSLYDPEGAPWAKAFPRVVPSFLQKIPGAKKKHELLAPLMPLAFESFNFDDFDLVVSVTSEAAKGVLTRGKTKHLCYCLTPTRYLWSSYDFYFRKPFLRKMAGPAVAYLRKWDKLAAQRPDVMVAISTAVKKRIKKYYQREAETIFPPLTLRSKLIPLERGDFYLIVSRLVPYKRVDLAIEVFNELGYPLVIVGTGSEEKWLKGRAGDNIKFVGQLTDEKLSSYYSKCRALVFAQEEDFGLVAVEAQSFGKPVVAFKRGGSLDIIRDGEAGVFFNEPNKESLREAITKLEKTRFNARIIKANAKRFAKERFKKEFLGLVGQGEGKF